MARLRFVCEPEVCVAKLQSKNNVATLLTMADRRGICEHYESKEPAGYYSRALTS